MLINEKIALSTSKVLLVPYERHHVPRYHTWMQDPDIQEATASEPMTLDEEYENQQSWRTSHDKLTFIVCAPLDETDAETAEAGVADTDEKMRGDVNFFLYPYEGDEAPGSESWLMGEIDIMIAGKEHRGVGLGQSAVRALLVYLHRHMALVIKEYQNRGDGSLSRMRSLMVKLKEKNTASRALFERLGFVQMSEVNYFGEVMLVMEFAKLGSTAWMAGAAADYREIAYLHER